MVAGTKPVGRVGEHEEAAIGQRHRAEEAGLGVGDRDDVAGCDLVAKDVGHAGVVAAAVQVPPVPGEHEALGDGLPEAELAHRARVAREHPVQLPIREGTGRR